MGVTNQENLVPDQKVPQVRGHNLDLRTLVNNSSLHPRHLKHNSRNNLHNILNNSSPRIKLDLVKDHQRIPLLLPQALRLRWVQKLLLV